jgi:hypothetical protein
MPDRENIVKTLLTDFGKAKSFVSEGVAVASRNDQEEYVDSRKTERENIPPPQAPVASAPPVLNRLTTPSRIPTAVTPVQDTGLAKVYQMLHRLGTPAASQMDKRG